MTTRRVGAVSDTLTNVSPSKSRGLIASSAARRWSLGRITRSRPLDASNAPNQKLSTDFGFQVAYLPAEGRLRGVQPALGGKGDAALLGDRHEIAQMS